MGAPGGGVAGHEEADGCVGESGGRGQGEEGGEVVAGLVFVAEVGEHVDDAALVDLGDVAGKEDVGGEEDCDCGFAGERGSGGEEGCEGFGGYDV